MYNDCPSPRLPLIFIHSITFQGANPFPIRNAAKNNVWLWFGFCRKKASRQRAGHELTGPIKSSTMNTKSAYSRCVHGACAGFTGSPGLGCSLARASKYLNCCMSSSDSSVIKLGSDEILTDIDKLTSLQVGRAGILVSSDVNGLIEETESSED